ncbi:MAG: efflux RND transporter periplasmic adaptor subunit, partial [Cycloclasticus sp.]|nr:efflux RND transporter periplasmic adaptor subunit [Cycloclasticus sp.]
MNNKVIVIMAPALLLAGLTAGYWLAGNSYNKTGNSTESEANILFYRNPMNPEITSPSPAKDDMGMDYLPVYAEKKSPKAAEILFYRNPMNPDITSPTPAKDNMGMDYIPVFAETNNDNEAPAGTVKIDGVTTQNIGVRTTKAVELALSHTVRAVGRVAYDEEKMLHLHPKTEGWIEKMHVDKTGQWVKKDTDLLSIYSPQLVTSQQE